MEIRRAKAADAHAIYLAQREIAQTPGVFCSEPSELSEQGVIKTIETLAKAHAGIFLVAEKEGQIVGHAFIEPLRLKSICHVAELSIVVHEGWQERGIGTALMHHIIDWAKYFSETIEKIELSVRASNTRAIALYKKMGFVEEGRLKNRVKVNNIYIDDILMALNVKNIEL